MAKKRIPLVVPDPLAGLIKACEVHCIAACCGARAFDLSLPHVVGWAREAGPENVGQARRELDELLERLRTNKHKIDCHCVNEVWTAGEALSWFQRVSYLLDQATKVGNIV